MTPKKRASSITTIITMTGYTGFLSWQKSQNERYERSLSILNTARLLLSLFSLQLQSLSRYLLPNSLKGPTDKEERVEFCWELINIVLWIFCSVQEGEKHTFQGVIGQAVPCKFKLHLSRPNKPEKGHRQCRMVEGWERSVSIRQDSSAGSLPADKIPRLPPGISSTRASCDMPGYILLRNGSPL